MKISEAIEQLKTIQNMFGDTDICLKYYTFDYEYEKDKCITSEPVIYMLDSTTYIEPGNSISETIEEDTIDIWDEYD